MFCVRWNSLSGITNPCIKQSLCSFIARLGINEFPHILFWSSRSTGKPTLVLSWFVCDEVGFVKENLMELLGFFEGLVNWDQIGAIWRQLWRMIETAFAFICMYVHVNSESKLGLSMFAMAMTSFLLVAYWYWCWCVLLQVVGWLYWLMPAMMSWLLISAFFWCILIGMNEKCKVWPAVSHNYKIELIIWDFNNTWLFQNNSPLLNSILVLNLTRQSTKGTFVSKRSVKFWWGLLLPMAGGWPFG